MFLVFFFKNTDSLVMPLALVREVSWVFTTGSEPGLLGHTLEASTL